MGATVRSRYISLMQPAHFQVDRLGMTSRSLAVLQIDRQLSQWCSEGTEPCFDACGCCCSSKWRDNADTATRVRASPTRIMVYALCWLVYTAPTVAVPAFAIHTVHGHVGARCGYEELAMLMHSLRVSSLLFLTNVLVVILVPIAGAALALCRAGCKPIVLGAKIDRPDNPAIDYLAGAPWFRCAQFDPIDF